MQILCVRIAKVISLITSFTQTKQFKNNNNNNDNNVIIMDLQDSLLCLGGECNVHLTVSNA